MSTFLPFFSSLSVQCRYFFVLLRVYSSAHHSAHNVLFSLFFHARFLNVGISSETIYNELEKCSRYQQQCFILLPCHLLALWSDAWPGTKNKLHYYSQAYVQNQFLELSTTVFYTLLYRVYTLAIKFGNNFEK